MDFVQSLKRDGIATLTLARGKVNAINGAVVDEMREQLKSLEHDGEVKSIAGARVRLMATIARQSPCKDKNSR